MRKVSYEVLLFVANGGGEGNRTLSLQRCLKPIGLNRVPIRVPLEFTKWVKFFLVGLNNFGNNLF